jgi:acyl dehydratase
MEAKLSFDDLRARVGQELGVSDWLTIDQSQIDRFAECTGDRNWIHVDVERARRESPFGAPVAHGYLTLSLLAPTALEILIRPAGITQAFNYGLDRVRFIAPVKVGARVRNRIKLLSFEDKPGSRVLLTTENTMEIEGEDKPALTAVALAMIAR